MTLLPIVAKELGDLLREKRFGGWALTYMGFWTFFLFVFLQENSTSLSYRRDHPLSLLDFSLGFYFVFAIAFIILALFILTDGITKERESGMLPVLGAKPLPRWHIVLAKLVAGLAVYVGAYVVTMLPTLVFAVVLGAPILGFITQLFLGPFLALYLFLLGAGLLMGVAFSTSKVAIGVGAAVYVPLFLMIPEGPMELLYRSYPELAQVAAWLPFGAVQKATRTLAYGGVIPWGGLLVTAALGVALAGAAFYTFHRQEVAA